MVCLPSRFIAPFGNGNKPASLRQRLQINCWSGIDDLMIQGVKCRKDFYMGFTCILELSHPRFLKLSVSAGRRLLENESCSGHDTLLMVRNLSFVNGEIIVLIYPFTIRFFA